MPTACGYTWSDELDAIIRAEATAAGVPLDLAYALSAAESGFDPRARNLSPIEDSVGLLQLNRRGGQGAGYTVEFLMDPRNNLRLGLPPVRRAWEQSWRPDIEPYELVYQVATRSGHPGPVPRNDPRIIRLATLWSCFYTGNGYSLAGPVTAPRLVPAPASALAADLALIVSFPLLFPAALAYVAAQTVAALSVGPIVSPPVTRQTFVPVRRPQLPVAPRLGPAR